MENRGNWVSVVESVDGSALPKNLIQFSEWVQLRLNEIPDDRRHTAEIDIGVEFGGTVEVSIGYWEEE